MGLSSTHLAFENMIASGIPTGGRRNVAELRMTDERLAATARHRCIRNHHLAGVDGPRYLVLRAAYSGEDWTRNLDATHGRGPRVELQRLFSHEVLQVAPLTRLAVRGVAKAQGTAAGATSSEPVYNDGSGVIGEVASALGLTPGDVTVTVAAARARLGELLRWVGTNKKPPWAPKPGDVLTQLRVVVGQKKPDHHATVKAARLALASAVRKANDPRAVTYVIQHGRPSRGAAATPREYILALLRAGDAKRLASIHVQAAQMLSKARKAAGVVTPEQFQRKPRRTKHVTPDADVRPRHLSEMMHGR